MNTKRWLLASLAAFVVISVIEFLVNGLLLSSLYKQTASLWRSEAEFRSMMWMFWLAYIVMGLMFAFIYAKGFEDQKSGVGQGLRYGLYMAIFTAVPMSLVWYVVLPMPGELAVYWAITGFVELILAGAAVGLIYEE
jgi:hypothetical protein